MINSLFAGGGADTVVNLCQNAKISLTGPIQFTAARQVLQTAGQPTAQGRATLQLVSGGSSALVYATGDNLEAVQLRSVIFDGNRCGLGRIVDGSSAIIEMGGNNHNQVVMHVKAFDPRGWSAFHAIEGYQNYCSSMQIKNNHFGPAGHAPTGSAQFRKRHLVKLTKRQNGGQQYSPGEWADGISLACKNSVVTNNYIEDATDGGIVLFGAPGSTISGNRIESLKETLLGGVNLVDVAPFGGDYSGVSIANNVFSAS